MALSTLTLCPPNTDRPVCCSRACREAGWHAASCHPQYSTQLLPATVQARHHCGPGLMEEPCLGKELPEMGQRGVMGCIPFWKGCSHGSVSSKLQPSGTDICASVSSSENPKAQIFTQCKGLWEGASVSTVCCKPLGSAQLACSYPPPTPTPRPTQETGASSSIRFHNVSTLRVGITEAVVGGGLR